MEQAGDWFDARVPRYFCNTWCRCASDDRYCRVHRHSEEGSPLHTYGEEVVTRVCHFCRGWCRDRHSDIAAIGSGMAEFYETGRECHCTATIYGSIRVLFEAIFLGIYLYTWDRFKNPYIHWLLTIPIVAGAGMSAVFITTVNGFMNQPEGFVMEAGQFMAVNPVQAMLNTATFSKVFHVLSSAYLTGAALLAGIAAFAMLRKGVSAYHKKGLNLMMAVVLVFSLLNSLAGDVSAKFLAEHQPEKLAAAEWHFETESGADLILLGWLNAEHEIIGALHLPKVLSFLAFGDFDAEVTGLNEFPPDEHPPLLVHYLFDLMAGIGFALLAISSLYFLFVFWKKRNQFNKWMLRMVALSAPLAFLAVEMGWFYAEIGRQPWIIRGYMRVEEAATSSPSVRILFFVFLLLYILLGVMCVVVLRRLFNNNPAELEMEKWLKEKHDQSAEKGGQA